MIDKAQSLIRSLLACLALMLALPSSLSAAQERGSVGRLRTNATRLPVAVDWNSGFWTECYWRDATHGVIFYTSDWNGAASDLSADISALEIDLANGIQRELRPLNKAFVRTATLNVQAMAADGSWFLCGTNGTGAAAIRKDGTVLSTWHLPFTMGSPLITPDGQSWIDSITTDHLRVGSLGQKSVRILSMKEKIGTNPIGFSTHGCLLTYEVPDGASSNKVLFWETSLQTGTVSRRWSVNFPKSVNVEEVVLSNDKQRLGWIIRQHDKLRPAPPISLTTMDLMLCGERTEIWVSRLDGTRMACVADEEPMIRAGEKVTDYPRRLHWLPDGKSLSFFYQRALYLLPSDTKRLAERYTMTSN